MKRAFSFSFFVISLIALATLLFFNGPGENAHKVLLKNSPSLSKIAKVLPQTQPPLPDHQESINIIPEGFTEKASQWTNLFLDVNQSMESRLAAWVNLKNIRPFPFNNFVQIARSKNPYKSNHIEPHSVDEQNFRREESFRIMALQSLEKAILQDPTQISTMAEIAKSASSPVVKKIAAKMREFAEKGLSYSEMAGQAILQSEIPN